MLSTHIELKEDMKEDGSRLEKEELNPCQCQLDVSMEKEEELEGEAELTHSFVEVCPMCQRLRYEQKRVLGEVREVM